jgi:hypothetical protein
VQFESSIRAHDEESLRYFNRRGFEKVGGEEAVALDLAEADARAPKPPHGGRGGAGSRARYPGRCTCQVVRRLARGRDRPTEPHDALGYRPELRLSTIVVRGLLLEADA